MRITSRGLVVISAAYANTTPRRLTGAAPSPDTSCTPKHHHFRRHMKTFRRRLVADAAITSQGQRDQGRLDESGGLVATFAERQALVGKEEFDALDRRYA